MVGFPAHDIVKYKALLPILINSKEKRQEIFAEAALRINSFAIFIDNILLENRDKRLSPIELVYYLIFQ